MKKILLVAVLCASGAFAAAGGANTTLVLKPNAAQVAASKAVGNRHCPVSGSAIGTMGEGYTVLYRGKAVALCCPGCVKAFAANPAKHLAAAEKDAAASAPVRAHH